MQAAAYDLAKREAWEKKCAEEAAAIEAAVVSAIAGSGSGSGGAAAQVEEKESFWSSDENEDDTGKERTDLAPKEPRPPPEIDPKEGILSEARKVLKAWHTLPATIDWYKECPELKQVEANAVGEGQTIDRLELLLHADVGPLYKKIESNDPDRRLFGYIPAMARSSLGQIGALNAESFCERILRNAGHVLSEGNTLLNEPELHKLVVLRMNKGFLKFMRAHHADVVKQQFGCTMDVKEGPRDGGS